VRAYASCPGKEVIKWVSVCLVQTAASQLVSKMQPSQVIDGTEPLTLFAAADDHNH